MGSTAITEGTSVALPGDSPMVRQPRSGASVRRALALKFDDALPAVGARWCIALSR
jgi:hypothetical protein